MARARHEGRWTHAEATVKGSTQGNRPWVLILCVALVVGLAVLGYSRYWNFQTVSYELRECAEPLTAESTWAEVQAAACDPVEPGSIVLRATDKMEQIEPTTVEGSTFSFEMIPVHSRSNGLRVELQAPARSIVIAEPENEQVRREMNSDRPGLNWTANIGSRGPLHYWVLITP